MVGIPPPMADRQCDCKRRGSDTGDTSGGLTMLEPKIGIASESHSIFFTKIDVRAYRFGGWPGSLAGSKHTPSFP